MKVNFNNLRRQAVHRYNDLCVKLNQAKVTTDDNVFIEGYGWLHKGDIVIRCEEIEKEMTDLRMLIGSVAMVYLEGDKEFANVYEEMFPENTDKQMAEFNPEQ